MGRQWSLASLFRFRSQERAQKLPEVIYLGCNQQDEVGSMRATLMERARRGDLKAL
jgi:hypothetical protein